MSWVNIVFTAIIRAFFVFAPAMGILTGDQKHFALTGVFLGEAKELMGTLNTRVLMLSWSPLIVVGLISRVEELQRSLKPLSVIVMIIIVFLTCMISFKLPVSWLRSQLIRWGIFVFVTFLDVLFKLSVQEQIIPILAN
jgi:hypothetical protein